MRKAKAVAAAPCALALAASALNLLVDGGLYSDPSYARIFFSNDIVNAIAAVCLAAIALAARPRQGLYIGIGAANVYIAAPLILSFWPRLPALIPAAALAIAIFGIIDQLKIEEVLASEKGPIRKEHVAYILIAFLLAAAFSARAAGILAGPSSPAQDRMTAVADLALVAIWLVLIAIAIVNADKRVASLGGIMAGGAVLNLSLLAFMLVDGAVRKGSFKIADFAVICALSVVFAVPAYRLLRIKRG